MRSATPAPTMSKDKSNMMGKSVCKSDDIMGTPARSTAKITPNAKKAS